MKAAAFLNVYHHPSSTQKWIQLISKWNIYFHDIAIAKNIRLCLCFSHDNKNHPLLSLERRGWCICLK